MEKQEIARIDKSGEYDSQYMMCMCINPETGDVFTGSCSDVIFIFRLKIDKEYHFAQELQAESISGNTHGVNSIFYDQYSKLLISASENIAVFSEKNGKKFEFVQHVECGGDIQKKIIGCFYMEKSKILGIQNQQNISIYSLDLTQIDNKKASATLIR